MKILYTSDMSKSRSSEIRKIDIKLLQSNFGRIGEINKVAINHIDCPKQRFAHVLWTKPMFKPIKDIRWHIVNQYELSLLISAVSLACLKALGQEVVLYTDSKGKELLDCLPYDRCYNIFDKLNINSEFWAAGKIMALQNEPLDSCIVDNDLFLYDGRLVDKLSNIDVAASHKESTRAYAQLIDAGKHMFTHLDGDSRYSANTGILKVNDFRRKQMFISAYYSCMRKLNNPELLSSIKAAGNGAYCVDLLCEQYNYYNICKPEYLVSVSDDLTKVNGFTHLLSFEKYVKAPLLLDLLKSLNSDYYERVLRRWKDLDFSIEIQE